MDAAVLGDRLPEVTQKPSSARAASLSTVPALRELEVLAGLVLCETLSQCPQSAFQGSPRVEGGVSSSLRPNPPRPFARPFFETPTGRPRKTFLKSHPWTNASTLGSNFLTNFQCHWCIRISLKTKHLGVIGAYEYLLKFAWTNGPQISLKVLVCTGIGP